jgi:hypothetical protein
MFVSSKIRFIALYSSIRQFWVALSLYPLHLGVAALKTTITTITMPCSPQPIADSLFSCENAHSLFWILAPFSCSHASCMLERFKYDDGRICRMNKQKKQSKTVWDKIEEWQKDPKFQRELKAFIKATTS